MTSTPTCSIPVLPNDILLRIFGILLEVSQPEQNVPSTHIRNEEHHLHKHHIPRRHFLVSIPLVSRAWRVLSQRALYKHVELRDSRMFSLFLKAVERQPDLGRFTTTLIVAESVRGSSMSVSLEEAEEEGAAAHLAPADAPIEGDESKAPALHEEVDVASADQIKGAGDSTEEEEEEEEEERYYYASLGVFEDVFCDLLRLLPNLKRLCMRQRPGFELQSLHMKSFPEHLDILCLHNVDTNSEVLWALPCTPSHLILDRCSISTLSQPLRFPELRCLEWNSRVKYTQSEQDTFQECLKVERLRIDIYYAGDAFNLALAPLLPRLRHLEIDIIDWTEEDEPAITFVDCFKMLSGLHYLIVNGCLESEDIRCLPPSIRTFTWQNPCYSGIGSDMGSDMEPVWTLCRMLQDSSTLPNLVAVPDVNLSPEGYEFCYDEVGHALRGKALDYMINERDFSDEGTDYYHSLWSSTS